jgi:ribosome-associated heat shock protein Hsp15
VRVNGTRATKPAASVGPGDVLTFAQARAIRVIRIVAGIGTRRGPAAEAQALYDDLDPPKADAPEAGPRRPAPHEKGASQAGRPARSDA